MKTQPFGNRFTQNPPESETAGPLVNMAIVGGGKACHCCLELLCTHPFPFLTPRILGIYDSRSSAPGIDLARKMGIHTTDNLAALLRIQGLDTVLELTGSQSLLTQVIRLKPKGVGVLEYNICKIFSRLFNINQRLKTAEQDLASTAKELVAEKTFSDFMIQQSTAAIVILNTDFTIVDANDAYLKTVNMPKEEVIGADCYRISHKISVPCSSAFPGVKCPMVETLRTGKNVHVIHDHKGPDGSPVYCNLTTYPVRNEQGEIIQVVEFWRDITDQVTLRWDARVKAMKSDLQQLVQEDRMISLGKLAASCAHEINNPIQGLLTFSHYMLEILAEGSPGPDTLAAFQEHLTLMATELERCGNIVSGLLSFSRESPVAYHPVHINEVLESVLSLTRHKLNLGNICPNVQLSPAPLILNGDINQLQQCFLNLVFNAIESMPDGGRLFVTSRLDKAKKYAWIEIKDTGSGIPEESQDKLFDPFFTTKDAGKGTGLGLSIVYGVVKNHKGTIKMESQVGSGTRFILKFPVS